MANNSSSGWFVIVVVVIGGAYLYQREGGKIFGPEGVVAAPKPPSPPRVMGFTSGWSTGTFSHDLLLTNSTGTELREVDLTIKMFREDGQTFEIKRFWATWQVGETKRINMPAHRYQKEEWKGTGVRGTQKVQIDDSWTTNWHR